MPRGFARLVFFARQAQGPTQDYHRFLYASLSYNLVLERQKSFNLILLDMPRDPREPCSARVLI